MPQLRIPGLLALLLGIGLCLFGCGGSKEDTTGNLGTTAPVNNAAPEAKNAPAAPHDPSIVYPGGGSMKKKGP